MLWEKDNEPLVKKMKGLFVVVSVVLSLSLAKKSTSDEVVLTAWPKGPHFYIGEPMVLTCEVKRNSSEEWIYSWVGPAHRVNNQTYTTSALTREDNGTYWCEAQNKNTSILLNNTVYLKVTADPPPASLEVFPNKSQHFKDEQFSLNCSVHDISSTNWILKRLRDAEEIVNCWKTDVSPKQFYRCSFNNITSGLSGLYWCEQAGGNYRSNAISIIVSDNPEEKKNHVAAWVWAVCVIVISVIVMSVTFLLVPSRRCGKYNAHQEMPRTKQDATEVQWDLPWMEMTNLLDKSVYPGN